MKYQEYIDLGFTRTDMNDSIEFKQTGYYGYCLDKQLNSKVSISVSSGELDRPKMYIKKSHGTDNYHVIVITLEMVKDLLLKSKNSDDENPFATAC